jgi:alpha-L-fucosidase
MKISDRSWGYIEGQQYKDPDVIIDGLVDRVSRGGGLVISLCPKADGTINEEQKMVLREIGDWLEVNGEAIYGTRTWKIHAEGNEEKLITSGVHPKWVFDSCNHQDIRFTTRDENLYMIALGWPEGGSLTVQSLGNNTPVSSRGIRSIHMLGSEDDLSWNRTDNELVIELPAEPPTKYATAFRIEVRGELSQ